MKRTFLTVFTVLLIVSVGSVSAWAQATAQISGIVKDQSGAVMPSVEVTATQTDTGISRSMVTNETGNFVLPNLPVGPYRLEAALPGFRTFVQTGIVLQVNASPVINPVLEIGQVSEEVEVRASAGQVELVSNAVGQVMENRSVLELPLAGRQVTDLLLLSAGTVTSGGVSNRGFPVIPVAIAGGGVGMTLYLLDGGTHNDPATSINIPVPFPDALQEFKVETTGMPARYGQHSSAVVSLVTKSGTNEFHGTAFEFVRNREFNARNPFALYRDPLKRNQFGGAIGGPIIHNKLFFFTGYQGTITRTDPTTQFNFVPTAAMLAGDFTAAASPACNTGRQLTLKTPIGTTIPVVNNQVSPSFFDPVAKNYLKFIPISTDPCGRIQYGYPTPSSEKQWLVRADYQKSDKHSIFARYFLPHYKSPYYYDGKNALTTPSYALDNEIRSLVGGDTFTISPTTINSFHTTYLQSLNGRIASKFVTPTEMGAAMYSTPAAANFTNLSITGGFGLGGGGNTPAQYDYTMFQAADTFDVIRGPHQLSFGFDYIHGNAVYYNTQYSNGQFAFDGSQTGFGLLDFLLGRASSIQQGADVNRHERSSYIGVFAQDSWKVSQRLTVNAGLRWDPYFPLRNQDKQVLQFNSQNFAQGKKSSVYTSAPAGLIFAGDPQYKDGSAETSSHLTNFAPRIGFVFDPRGEGKETIRASYGVFFDSIPMFDYVRVASVAPWGTLVTLNSVQLSNPYANYPGGNPFPFKVTPTTPFPTQGTYWAEPDDAKPTYVQQWNLSVQKQLSGVLVTTSYIGNKTTHIWNGMETNPAIVTPTATTANTNQRRLLYLANPTEGQYYAQLIIDNQGGNATYNAWTTSLERRVNNRFSVSGNYTWSHCINDIDPQAFLDQSYSNAFNRRFDHGSCSTDRRHILNMSGTLAAPRLSGVLGVIASNWQIAPIFQKSSGVPLTVTSGRDIALIGSSSGQRVNIVGDPKLEKTSVAAFFNPAAFSLPANGTFGNLGRNVLRGRGSWNINLALSRKFTIQEKNTIEIRAEAFNLDNHARLGSPNTSFTSALFGQTTSASDPRIMQFAIKYTR
jgi:carboxypeptidase family protein